MVVNRCLKQWVYHLKWVINVSWVYLAVLKVQPLLIENDPEKLANSVVNRKPIDQGGLLKFVFGKEYHAFNPDVINHFTKLFVQVNTKTLKNMQSW